MGDTIYPQLVALVSLFSPVDTRAATSFFSAEVADVQKAIARKLDGRDLGRRPDRRVTLLGGETPPVECTLTRVGELSTEKLPGAHHFVSNAGSSVFLFV